MYSHIYMIGLNFSAYNARGSRSNGVRAKMRYERHDSPQTTRFAIVNSKRSSFSVYMILE